MKKPWNNGELRFGHKPDLSHKPNFSFCRKALIRVRSARPVFLNEGNNNNINSEFH
jgi:hypothetical protein